MAQRIHNFTTNLIAFYRPIKKTYFFLTWNSDVRKWLKYKENIQNLSLHRSTVTQSGKVNIIIAKRPVATGTHVEVTSDGYYLKSGNIVATLVRQSGNALPQTFMAKEYAVVDASAPAVETNFVLWSLSSASAPSASAPSASASAAAPFPVPAPIPSLSLSPSPSPSLAPPIHILTHLKPIPRRIAWIIAEDACKNKESCSITTDDISPITAAVTTCFHVFDNDSLNEWFARNPVKTKCPVCREVCLMTKAFE